ncbi:hypothetical protein IFM89_005175 [Coptis chinensis]|uniref:Zinc finger PHD-type domain-containing protein n=1 Tax=Coptis chinensis TaxID=261450 RepID=A0A835IJY3_9MAGN|nr:hypothetical protein IFM89_005175 [Coptis chinensis]
MLLLSSNTVGKEGENDVLERPVIRRVSCSDKISLRDIARERVEIISERMILLPEEIMEELKAELRVILEGTGGSQHREEFLVMQKLVQNRVDLTAKTLSRAHRVQLEVLVAINTGIQAFLHPNICLSQTSLMEVFLYKRCRNIACQNQIPADDCTCDVCSNRNGFCNHCMCVICNKFDFEVNTCRWIGCDLCSHWTHTDCAIREGQVVMGPCVKSGGNPPEMLFRCRACNRTSELLGWVKDVFQHCAPGWDREALVIELDVVSRIFRGSEDPRGRKMFWKCEELIEKMKSGVSESTTYKVMLMFFQGSKSPFKCRKGFRALSFIGMMTVLSQNRIYPNMFLGQVSLVCTVINLLYPKIELQHGDEGQLSMAFGDRKAKEVTSKQCEDPTSILPLHWGEIYSFQRTHIVMILEQSNNSFQGPPLKMHLKLSPRLPKRGDILIDINDRFPRDFLSDIFSKERLTEDSSSISLLYNDGTGLSINIGHSFRS